MRLYWKILILPAVVFTGILIFRCFSSSSIVSAAIPVPIGTQVIAGLSGSASPPFLSPTATRTPTTWPTPTPSATLNGGRGPSPTGRIQSSPTGTATASATPTKTPPGPQHLPIVLKPILPTATPTPTSTPTPPPPADLEKVLLCNDSGFDIPDDSAEGASSSLTTGDVRFITDLDLRLDIDHPWIGDLAVRVSHQESGRSVALIDRPGYPQEEAGCNLPDIRGILDDDITLPAEQECAGRPAAISGSYLPEQPLEAFDGLQLAGTWVVAAADLAKYDNGHLNGWCLYATVSDAPQPPQPPPTVEPPPASAMIDGVTGQRQSLPLDCESRSAVDWANYFGVDIGEIAFFESLPESDNPDLGFVGDVNGAWGQTPPDPYGVHAEPVARQLRQRGLEAYAHRPLTWDQLRSEIAQGRPVIAWITGSYVGGFYDYVVNGLPLFYVPSEGDPMVVAPFEHTVIVTGYTSDRVYYLNGANHQDKSLKQFLESWSALGNMAITGRP